MKLHEIKIDYKFALQKANGIKCFERGDKVKDYEYMPDVCKKCKKKENCKYTLHDGKMDCRDWMKWLKLHWGAIHNYGVKMYGRKK